MRNLRLIPLWRPSEYACVLTTEVVPNAPQQAHTAATATQGAALTEIGAPAIPNVRWADIGGLAHARDEILDMVKCE